MKQYHDYSNQAAARARRKVPTALLLLAPALAVIFLLGGLVWRGEASLAQGTWVTVSPSSAQLAVGETVTVDVRVEDVTSLWGARVKLTFDPAVLQVVDADAGTAGVQIARGDFIDPREGRSWVLVNLADNAAGTIEYAATLLNNARNPVPPASGSGVLARITFRGLAQGSSAVAFAAQDVELYDEQGSLIQATIQNGSISVSAGVKLYLPLILRNHRMAGRLVGLTTSARPETPPQSSPSRGTLSPLVPADKPGFLTEYMGPNNSGYGFHFWYTTDCLGHPKDCVVSADTDGDGHPDKIEEWARLLDDTRERYINDLGFRDAYFYSDEERQVWVYAIQEECGCAGDAWPSQIRLDPRVVNENIVVHELFHSVQYSYVSEYDLVSAEKWRSPAEGTSGFITDSVWQHMDHGPSEFLDRLADYLETHTDKPLIDAWYRTALFWKYFVERLGTEPDDPAQPEYHIDVIRAFWEAAEAGAPDTFTAIEEVMAARGSNMTYRDLYIDFVVANYLKNLDGRVPEKYRYQDEREETPRRYYAWEDSFGNQVITPSLEIDLPLAVGEQIISRPDEPGFVRAWTVRYYQVRPAPDLPSINIEFRQETFKDLAYVLLIIKDGDLIQEVRSIGRDFAHTVLNDEYDLLTVVVGGLEDNANYRYSFNGQQPILRILDPLTVRPAQVGDPSAPDKFLIKCEVLNPAGGGTAVEGIPPSDFTVTIGSTTLPREATITGAYIQGQYWLVVQPPTQTIAASLDLTVTYTTLSDTQADAVVYSLGQQKADNVLAIDHSGSMATSDKMAAAQNAARLFVDSWGEGDKIGVVSFATTSTVDISLRDWTTANRDSAIQAIDALTAGDLTNIGDALLDGLKELATRGDASHGWAIVLLSDGMETVDPPTMPNFYTEYGNRVATYLQVPVVHAIAIGPDANRADLQYLADYTGGTYLYAADVPPTPALAAQPPDERTTEDLANDLAEYYRAIAETVGHQQQVYLARGKAEDIVPDASITHTIRIDAGAREAVFAVNWRTRQYATAPAVQLYRPDGTLETPDATNRTHVVYRVGSPPQGDWRLVFTRACQYGEFCFDGTYLVEASLKSPLTMGLYVNTPIKNRLEGASVPILVSLADSAPVLHATVEAKIVQPNGNSGTQRLYDDGRHGDGGPNDGIYGYTYPSIQEPGSYVVEVTARGTTTLGGAFTRRLTRSFHLKADANRDGDCMPDAYETEHGLNPTRDDGREDPDLDGLDNCLEWALGTHPRKSDSDGGGESDASEVLHRDPWDPADDQITPPREIRVEPGVRQNTIYFSVQPNYHHLNLYRSSSEDADYQLVNDHVAPTGVYTDTGLTNDTTYYYRLQALGGPTVPQSALTRVVSGTPRADPWPPAGFVLINDGARVTQSRDVTLTLLVADDAVGPFVPYTAGGPRARTRTAAEASQAGLEVRISNRPSFAGATWEPYVYHKSWTIEPRADGTAKVYVRFRDAAGNVSETARDSIRYFEYQPPACPRGGQVDVVFVMDTSGSMDDEFQALCSRIGDVAAELQGQGTSVHYEILGITQNKLCATDNVAGRFPNAAANTPEDWGPAVADVAANYPWREVYTRLIIPMSDEGPADGDPTFDPGADRDAINAAIEAAQARQVIVSPVLGTFISEDPGNWAVIQRLANDLAQATGGQVFSSTDPASDLAEGISNLIGSAACTPVLNGVYPNCEVNAETTVHVFGQNFLENAYVLVDDQPARDVTVLQDPERIAFKIPEGLAAGTYDVTVVNAGIGRYTLRAALTVGPCSERCEGSQPGDIWTPMWDLWDGKMDLLPVADASGTLTVGLFNGEGAFQVKVYDMQENLLAQMLVAEGETKTVSVSSAEDAQYRVFVAGGEAEHPHFRAFFRGAKRVALPDFGDDWERTEGVPHPGPGVDHGVESNPELGFDKRWQDAGNVYADTIWYFYVSQSSAPLGVRVWSEYPEGDGHGGMEWITPDEIAIPLVGPEPAGFYHTFTVTEPQTGWWGLRIKADAPFTPWAQHYSLSRVSPEGGEHTTPPDFIYLLPTSMKAPPCGPTVILNPPRKGACKSAVVPVDITVSDVNNLYGAEVHLSFDPTKLEVVDATRAVTDVIIPGPFPDPGEGRRLIAQNYADNISGTIDYAVTLLHPAPAAFGDGVLARILFHVKEPGANVVRFTGGKLDERPIPPFGPKPIPADWQGGLIVGRDCIPGQPGQGEINGRVILQARRNHSGAVVRAAPWPHLQITGADGTYSLAPLRTGTYTVVITHTSYLRTDPRLVTVTAGQPISMATAILLGGDVNGDGKIGFLDAVIISLAFTYQRGESGYREVADIDADGVVDIDDLVLVGANWQCTVLDTTPRCRRWRD